MSTQGRAERSFGRRMKREGRMLAAVVVRCSATDPVSAVSSYLSIKLSREWRRSVRRHAGQLVDPAEVTNSGRLNGILARVHESLTAASAISPRMLEARARMSVVTALTAVRTAAALDVVDACRGSENVAAAAKKSRKKKKSKKKRRVKLTKEWTTVGDMKVCGTCADLDGTVVNAYTGTFEDDDGNEIPGPPEHPNCRCELTLSRG